jgi:ketosteroid isomerase-like protein
MSRENVELVRSLQPGPDMDLVQLIREDTGALLAAILGPHVHDDFVARASGLDQFDVVGIDGLQAAWAEWLAPWESYRTEIEEMIDAGDEVVVLTRDFGRRPGMDAEIGVRGVAIWTVRDGRVACVTFYADRAEGLAAAGLEDRA